MSVTEFRAVCLELIKQYKTLEKPVKRAIDALLLSIETASEDDIEAIITTVHSTFYDR